MSEGIFVLLGQWGRICRCLHPADVCTGSISFILDIVLQLPLRN